MEIRRLKPCEHGRTRPLYEEIFPEDDAEFVDYYYTWKTRDNVIFVAEDGDGIHAMVHLNPFCVRYFGRDVQMHYIVAVATQPQYRHRGLMRNLLALAEQEMRAAGEPFTFLMPASEAIYRPFGYRFFAWQRRGILRGTDDGGEHREDAIGGCLVNDGDMHVAAGAGADQRMSDCTNAAGITCRPLRPHEYNAAADFANAVLDKEYDMYVLRDGAYYERLCAEQRCQGGEVMAICRSIERNGDAAASHMIIGLFCTALNDDGQGLWFREVILALDCFSEAERALRAFAAPYGRVAVEGCQERLALEQVEAVPLMMGKALSQAEDAEWLMRKMPEQMNNPKRRSIFINEVV